MLYFWGVDVFGDGFLSSSAALFVMGLKSAIDTAVAKIKNMLMLFFFLENIVNYSKGFLINV